MTVSEGLLLRPAEAASLLGVSRSKLYAMAQAGALPGVVRLGGSIRVHRATLEAALEAEAKAATSTKVTALEVWSVRSTTPTT